MDPNSIASSYSAAVTTGWLGIPDVVWAAVIAALLTITGVIITNIFNRRNIKQQIEHTTEENNKEREIQKLQLKHASEENDKERKIQLKKAILIEAVEAITAAVEGIMHLTITLTSSDKFEIGSGMLLAIAKIHMVGALDTIKAINKFNQEFDQKVLPLRHPVERFRFLQKTIKSTSEICDFYVKSMNEYAGKMQKLIDAQNASSPSYGTHESMFKNAGVQYETANAKLTKANAELEKLNKELLSQCLLIGLSLQKDALPVIVSIRKELDFDIDTETYMTTMEPIFSSTESLIKEILLSSNKDEAPPA
jgi:hypothetical protein